MVIEDLIRTHLNPHHLHTSRLVQRRRSGLPEAHPKIGGSSALGVPSSRTGGLFSPSKASVGHGLILPPPSLDII